MINKRNTSGDKYKIILWSSVTKVLIFYSQVGGGGITHSHKLVDLYSDWYTSDLPLISLTAIAFLCFAVFLLLVFTYKIAFTVGKDIRNFTTSYNCGISNEKFFFLNQTQSNFIAVFIIFILFEVELILLTPYTMQDKLALTRYYMLADIFLILLFLTITLVAEWTTQEIQKEAKSKQY